MTSGWFSILLTTMLAWSPPAESLETKPVSFKLQDFRGAWHQLDEAGQSQAGRHRLPGNGVPAGEPVCPAAGRAGACLREEGRRVLRRRLQPAGRALGAVAVRPGARPAVPDAQGRGQRAGRPAGRRADARGLRAGRGTGRALSRTGGRPVRLRRAPPGARRIATSPRRSTTCSPAVRSPRRGPSPPAAGSAGSPRPGGMRPSRTRSRWPASSATAASPATARARSRRSRWRRTRRPPAGPR